MIQWIAKHPGGSYQQALAAYGKGDLSLVIGHLVYHRFGHFRSLIPLVEKQSDLQIERTEESKAIHYKFRPEALAAFHRIGLLK